MSTLIDRINHEQARETMLELRAANQVVARTRELLRRKMQFRDGLADQLDRYHAEHITDRPESLDRLLRDLAEDADPVDRNAIDDARTPEDHAAAMRRYGAGV